MGDITINLNRNDLICQTCRTNNTKYKCPKPDCPAPGYCSVACYKEHSKVCSEAFYRDKVLESLNVQNCDHEDYERINDILLREKYQDNNEVGDDHNEEYDALLQQFQERLFLDGDDAIISDTIDINQLPSDIRQDFEVYVAKYEVKAWSPWWKPQYHDDNKVDNFRCFSLDDRILNLPKFSILFPFNHQVPMLQYNTVEIVFVKCMVLHLFNGDCFADDGTKVDSAILLYDTCKVLSCDARWSNLDEAMLNCFHLYKLATLNGDCNVVSNVLVEDVVDICSNYRFVLRIFFECDELLKLACALLKKNPTKTDKGLVKKLRLARKKLEFYSSWCFYYWTTIHTSSSKGSPLFRESIKQYLEYDSILGNEAAR